MSVYPEYMDCLDFANIHRGQIPFYCLKHTIQDGIPLHHHDFVELSFVIRGRGTETLNGVAHPLRPGSVTVLLPHHLHELRSDPADQLEVYCCMFDISLIFELQAHHELGQQLLQTGHAIPSYLDLNEAQAVRMQQVCAQLHEEYSGGELGRDSLLRAKIIEALLIYYRSCKALSSQAMIHPRLAINPIDWRILQYIHSHYLDNLSQDTLSEMFHVRPAYISQMFNKYLGSSFPDYVHTLRIRRASSLLLTTTMTIYEISVDAGFDSFRTFSRAFRKIRRMTPSEYRQQRSRVL